MFVQIPDFADYMVDENGQVASMKFGRWKLLRPRLDTKNGYLKVVLCFNGKQHSRGVHSLVAAAFLGPKPEGMCVNHSNGVKTDNALTNLEYVTPSQNTQHAHDTGLAKSPAGENHNMAKLSDTEAAKLLALKGTMSQTKAAALFNITQQQVSNLWSGKSRPYLRLADDQTHADTNRGSVESR